MRLTLAAAAAALPLLASPALAQSASTELANALSSLQNNPAKDASLFDFSYGEAGSPVLPLVGVQADQITRVESVRRFGVALLSGSESAGTGPAFALDFSPYWMLAQGAVSLQDYRQFTPVQRAIARAKGSVAVSEGDTSKATPSSVVFSLSTKLLAAQDPLKDATFETCIKGTPQQPGELWKLADQVEAAGIAALPAPGSAGDANAAFDRAAAAKALELRPAMERAYNVCTDKVAKLMARRASFDIGGGLRLNGKPGAFKDVEETGAIVWATYATGALGGDADSAFARSLPALQVRGVVHARYTLDEETFDAAGARTGAADAGLIAAGLESVPAQDGSDRLRWSLQAGWNKQGAPNASVEKKDYWRYLGVAQARIGQGLWLNGTIGRVQGDGVESDTYLMIGVSFAPSGGTSAIEKFYSKTRY